MADALLSCTARDRQLRASTHISLQLTETTLHLDDLYSCGGSLLFGRIEQICGYLWRYVSVKRANALSLASDSNYRTGDGRTSNIKCCEPFRLKVTSSFSNIIPYSQYVRVVRHLYITAAVQNSNTSAAQQDARYYL
ncbi:hypothetical protein Tco_0604586 [Tanacetum coccineum]